MKNKIIYIFFLIGLSTFLYSQPPNFVKKQFTIEDGLPSNESHDIVQDANGYIWIATDRGLVRYDGYAFKIYGIQKGLKDISCLKLFLDKNDDIWILTLSKSIYIYKQENDKIEKYKYADKLNVYAQLSQTATDIYVTKDLTVFITYVNVFTVSIDKFGEVCEYRSDNPFIGHQITQIDDYCMFGDDRLDENLKDKAKVKLLKKYSHGNYLGGGLTYSETKYEIPFNDKWDGVTTRKCYLLKNGKLLVTMLSVHFIIENDKITSYKNGDGIHHLLENENHEVYTAQGNKIGVKYFQDSDQLLTDNFSYILKNISASKIFFDKDNNLWISTLEDGIFHLKRSQVEPINTFTNKTKVSDVEITKNGNLYFIENDLILGQNSINSNLSKVLKKYPSKVYNLFYDQTLDRLFIATLSSEYFNNGAWINMYTTFLSRKVSLSSKNIKRIDANTLVTSIIGNFYLIKGDEVVENFNSYNDTNNDGLRITDIASYNKGSLLLGTTQGLYVFEDNVFKSLDTIFPIFSTRINKILHHNNSYLLGTQGNGVLLWDGKNKIKKYSKSEGLTSDVIENIKINTNGQIYLATYSGLSIMVPVDTGYQIKNYTTAHGLPSNEVFDIDYYRDVLYVATGKGLCKLKISTTINQVSKSPIFEGIYVNNIKYDINNGFTTLTYDQNNLKINYKTIDYTLNGDISYRYKLNQGTWNNTRETSLNFLTLDPGHYAFEVQSKNADGIWSTSRKIDFSIRPPFYKTLWFYILAVILLSSMIYIWYSQRLKKVKAEAQLNLELQILERKALQAQMNPHFIFNCLHSIQSFIMDNNKEAAMNYLSQFAKLVRLNLQSSVLNELPLDKEITMLQLYLDLEMMRFSGAFKYTIETIDIPHPSEIKIPPILIQPFVENAILHGMKEKTEGGLISITFSITNDLLKVEVKDNGKGIQTIKNKERTSYGISITQKRFEHIAKSKGSEFDIDTVSKKNGTTVTLTMGVK